MGSQSQRHVIVYSPTRISADLLSLLSQNGWSVFAAQSMAEACLSFQQSTPLVGIISLDTDSVAPALASLPELLGSSLTTNWILLLPDPSILSDSVTKQLDELIAAYCFDYQHYPLQETVLLSVLGHAYGMAEIAHNPAHVAGQEYGQYGLIGNSERMQRLYRQIHKVCQLEAPVLICGETGTGKELVANAIHYHSSRAEKQLVVINCGSLADSLIQAELFGYEKGAFTGAYRRKVGLIEASNGGSLFLDEIGDLPLSQQANLLRFLQEKTIVRVGGYEQIPVDIRVIAATNIDLKQAVQEGRFREDLFYRLNVLHIELPPLREREGDIELLSRFFLNHHLSAASVRPKGLSADALHVLYQHDWKGNVRELSNTISHAQIMSEKKLIRPCDLDLERRQHTRRLCTLEQSRADAERHAIVDGLRQCRNNVSKAAESLGISRVTLYRLMNKYQLNIDESIRVFHD
jgi:DNA-binding NtrC family response regulator